MPHDPMQLSAEQREKFRGRKWTGESKIELTRTQWQEEQATKRKPLTPDLGVIRWRSVPMRWLTRQMMVPN